MPKGPTPEQIPAPIGDPIPPLPEPAPVPVPDPQPIPPDIEPPLNWRGHDEEERGFKS